jgi:hypothetical protein
MPNYPKRGMRTAKSKAKSAGKTVTSVGAGYKDKRGNTMSPTKPRYNTSKMGVKSAVAKKKVTKKK